MPSSASTSETESASGATRDIVVVGASVGGIEAMKVLIAGLPEDLPAAVFFVQHIGAHGQGLLPMILQKHTKLRVSSPADGETIRRGHVYVAPPDRHLLVEAPDRMRITHGPKENRTRPAVDPLFRSAAVAFGARVIGVVLSGNLDDGTAGLWAIKDRGGVSIVQDPKEAMADGMPASALAHVAIDHCVPVAEISTLLRQLTREPAPMKGGATMSEQMKSEVNVAMEDKPPAAGAEKWGDASIYACPECHGVLLKIKEGGNVRFRCHTGHAYSVETLVAEYDEKTEEALANSYRALREKKMLLDQLAEGLAKTAQEERVKSLREKAAEAERQAEMVRKVVLALRPSFGNGESSDQ